MTVKEVYKASADNMPMAINDNGITYPLSKGTMLYQALKDCVVSDIDIRNNTMFVTLAMQLVKED